MDFIIKLPILRILESNDKFDSIFIIINRKGKIIYFVSYREVINAKEFVSLFYKIVISRYRIPVEIILDKDKLFISKFWEIPNNKTRGRVKTIYGLPPIDG